MDLTIPLYLFTFNCAKLRINASDFVEHITPTLPDEPPHLFVFGFQELCSIMDGCFPDLANKHLIDINRIVLDTLRAKYGSGAGACDFTTVGFHHIGAIGMIAISPFPLKFRDCKYAEAGCGNANSLLKGAIGLRIRYQAPEHVELTFAVAHLAAYEGEFYYQKRLDNLQTLMRALDFGDGYSFVKPRSHAFFMGDLNFRAGKGKPKAELVELHDENSTPLNQEIENLVDKHDELTIGRNNGEVFTGFGESCVTFRPTYKFHQGTAIYNTKRCPLWCDRVLYQNTYKKAPEVHLYDSVDSYLRSDHRPVYLHISVPVDAPEAIIGTNGYLMILPSARPNRHVDHALGTSSLWDDILDAVSGPTQIYMKCTVIDKLTQLFVRRASDWSIGYGLWLGTTSRGRVTLLGLVLVLWMVFSMLS